MIVIKIEGINGDCGRTGHEKWIDVSSMQIGVGRSITSVGGGADRETSNPSFSELTFTKPTDISSTNLFAQAISGKALGKVANVHLLQTGGASEGGDQIYMELELHDPIVSSYSVSSGGERPDESFSVNFTKIVMKYTKFEKGGKKVQADPKGWDLMTGEPFTG
ncbi:MAG: Hcp family type VI secretion system effector [Planctomycetota bacterium]